ncbi:MAG: aminoacetone oxidase family FAD-binding enzyme [Candidatus Abawacabacteria bacterium]|nr:aminoacetone oxidase family FAD-binding enzyme [Candidatus Abawacabacteria bacterium]
MKKIAVIGGGAAGMMVVATLLENNANADIHLFEKNPSLGKKVIISGGGRCNVTTGINEARILERKYIRGWQFLKPSLANFPPEKVYNWFEKHGVPLKNEADNRVFPQSDQGTDIVAVFERIFAAHNVHLHLNQSVQSMTPEGNAVRIRSSALNEIFDYVVITTGGNAYRHTGSTGDGYDFAKACGHSITALGPSLNSFEVAEEWPKMLTGISFPWAQLVTLVDGEKMVANGPFLFTHFGISGPVTFAFSAHVAFLPIHRETPLPVCFSPDASVNFEQWNNRLQKLFAENGAKQVHSILSTFFPKRFVDVVLNQAMISHSKQVATISKDERKLLAYLFSGRLTFSLIARRAGDEFVTAGGVNTDEIDRKSMQSKIISQLYFAGEVMNIDGVTGGFNLQVAWATGRMAGESIAKRLQKGDVL